jgi:hypothetical protein
MATAYQAAQTLYDWAYEDHERIASIRAAYEAAISGAYLSKGGTNAIQSASKNGVSYSVMVGLSEVERIACLRVALAYLDAKVRPSSKGKAQF